MNIYEKMKNEKINIYIEEFVSFTYDTDLNKQIDLVMTEKFGKTFDEIWFQINFKDKIEIIILLHKNLKHFFNKYEIKIFMNKLYKFLENEGYEIKKDKDNNLILVESEISNLLSESNDENLKDVFLKFRKATTLKDKEAEIFKIQKELYKNIRNDQTKHDVLNIENIKRLNEVFVRHHKEANDKVIKPYYDGLLDEEKIKKLDDLFLAFLILNIRYNKK